MAFATKDLGVFRVHYPDGKTVDVPITGKALVETERRWPGIAADGSDRYRPNEGVHFMVWVAMGKPEGNFDKWLDTDIVLEPVEAAPTPTKPIVGVA